MAKITINELELAKNVFSFNDTKLITCVNHFLKSGYRSHLNMAARYLVSIKDLTPLESKELLKKWDTIITYNWLKKKKTSKNDDKYVDLIPFFDDILDSGITIEKLQQSAKSDSNNPVEQAFISYFNTPLSEFSQINKAKEELTNLLKEIKPKTKFFNECVDFFTPNNKPKLFLDNNKRNIKRYDLIICEALIKENLKFSFDILEINENKLMDKNGKINHNIFLNAKYVLGYIVDDCIKNDNTDLSRKIVFPEGNLISFFSKDKDFSYTSLFFINKNEAKIELDDEKILFEYNDKRYKLTNKGIEKE